MALTQPGEATQPALPRLTPYESPPLRPLRGHLSPALRGRGTANRLLSDLSQRSPSSQWSATLQQLPGAIAVTDLAVIYRAYIACLNRQDWPELGQFVDDGAIHNGRRLGLSGYRAMLERDFDDIPDLHFNIEMLVREPPYVASRLAFDCTPKGVFLGLPVNGKRVSFTENVIYAFRDDKIVEVWSVIDKTAIEAQL